MCGQPVSFGTSGGECVPWQLVILFGRRENDMESELVSWNDYIELFCLLTDSKETQHKTAVQ